MKPLPALLGAVMLLTLPASAQDTAPHSLRKELVSEIGGAFDKMIDLARAMPPESYEWRPAPGVRSVSEVFVHAVSTCYRICVLAGVRAPADLDLEVVERVTEKQEVIELLQDVRDHAIDSLVELDDAVLEEKVTWHGGSEKSVRGALIVLSNHTAEHLGQMIAYARMNDVTPPWSAP